MKKIKVEELCDRELLEEILRVVQGKKNLSGNNDLPEPDKKYPIYIEYNWNADSMRKTTR